MIVRDRIINTNRLGLFDRATIFDLARIIIAEINSVK